MSILAGLPIGADFKGEPDLGWPPALLAPRLDFGEVSINTVDMMLGLRWFAAPELTLAPPEAPRVARRALDWSRYLEPPANTHTNASFGSEVQSDLRLAGLRFASRNLFGTSSPFRYIGQVPRVRV